MTTPVAQPSQQYVTSSGDVRIAVYEQGNPDGPTVVLAHGWPDSHVLWDNVVPLLAERCRIVSYDNRGVGGSSVPRRVADYTMARFADDFAAVIDAVSPHRPVHVLAHDWGSAAVWEYLGRPQAGERVASFTSLSGPSADHLVHFIRDRLARPYRPRRFAQALSQALRLTYMAVFSIPVLLPLLMRAFGARLIRQSLILRDGIEPARVRHSDNFAAEAAASMKVYPANFFRSAAHVRRDHYIGVPVQVIVNTRDPYVRPHSYDDTSRWVPRLWRRDIWSGHWSPFSHPAVLARAVGEMVDVVEGRPPSRAMRRARVGRRREPFADTLVSVTGAGNGIGRATALEFARLGAEVVVSDIDEVAVRSTAADIAAQGGLAHAYSLDVSDADAVEAFADDICREHGVPDIVVNNAGIGQVGRLLDTPAGQWERVLDINLGGVVNGCRAFASRLVDRGTGGHIVNMASAAAYWPAQSMNAYCTSKAAVFMFSDCLRAELAAAGVGLTTVCPGPINTNIIATTRIDAPQSQLDQVDRRRQQLEKLFAVRGYGPERVAKAIVSAVQKNNPIRPVTPEAYLLYGTARLLPQVLRSTARGKLM